MAGRAWFAELGDQIEGRGSLCGHLRLEGGCHRARRAPSPVSGPGAREIAPASGSTVDIHWDGVPVTYADHVLHLDGEQCAIPADAECVRLVLMARGSERCYLLEARSEHPDPVSGKPIQTLHAWHGMLADRRTTAK